MSNDLEQMGLVQMDLSIKIVNGQPEGHPVLNANLEDIYGSMENAPSDYQPFIRVSQNVIPGLYQNAVSSYQQVDGVWQDVWAIVDMTEEEITVRKQEVHAVLVDREKTVRQKLVNRLASSTDQNFIDIHQQYLAVLDNWELDINDPVFPEPPYLDKDTNLWRLS